MKWFFIVGKTIFKSTVVHRSKVLQNNSEVREVRNITNDSQQRLEDFLQGAVYSWCKNNKNKWFALRNINGCIMNNSLAR